MTEGARVTASAGALLRAARERQGLHIAALAAAIKVAPRKLDALENDRWHELPDATFARALAQTVCRTLKIEAKPVLDLMPRTETAALESVSGHMNAPFRERPGRGGVSGGQGSVAAAIRPMVWAGAALMVAALVVYFAPDNLLSGAFAPGAAGPTPAASAGMPLAPAASAVQPSLTPDVPAAPTLPVPAASAAQAEPAASAAGLTTAQANTSPAKPAGGETVFLAPAPGANGEPPGNVSSAVAGPVLLRTSAPSWVDVRDAKNQVLLSRIVQPGEAVGLDGTLPIRVTIGNAAVTQLGFRGQPVDLAPSTRENVARVELK